MEILSASDARVITDMGLTYLSYTFSQEYKRYDELVEHRNTLKDFTQQTESVPTIYDVQIQSKNEDEFISFTGQKPPIPPLTEYDTNLSMKACQNLLKELYNTVKTARKYGIYHLDIGFHTVSYDAGLEEFHLSDWYDSVLTTPTTPPFYISEYIPPSFDTPKQHYSDQELQNAENYQLCCFTRDLLQTHNISVPTQITESCTTQELLEITELQHIIQELSAK